jgi:hypothetical protein
LCCHPTRRSIVLALGGLALLCGGLAIPATAMAAPGGPPTAADCAAAPTRAGCVTSIKYVDPSTVTAVQNPDGTVSGAWDPAARGTVEQLPNAIPVTDAAARASSNAAAHGLQITPQPAPSATRAHAKARQWSGDCTYIAYAIWFVALDSYNAHYHFESQQYCSTNENFHGVSRAGFRGDWVCRFPLFID